MALDPQFGSIPVVGSNVPSATADSSLTAPAHAVTLLGGQSPRQVIDGTTATNTTVTSATAAFNSGDIGRPISGGSIPSGTIITVVASATSVTISQPATATASALTLTLGGGTGTRVEQVVWIPNTSGSPTVAGALTLFLYDGTTYHYIDSAQVTAQTPSTTVPISNTNFVKSPYTNLWVPNGWTLVFSSTVASQLTTVTAWGENL
jgi:hypothetical protein